MNAQNLTPFKFNQKCGFREGQTIKINAEYDTVFPFDKTQRIAMAANISDFKKNINPLTGEEMVGYDYFFIDRNNSKIKILPEQFPDSVSVFPDQQELKNEYLNSQNCFKVLLQGKLYLVSKIGKQLSVGFDNLSSMPHRGFFEAENHIVLNNASIRKKGLLDSSGKVIVPCKYAEITLNLSDSLVFCCSAFSNNKANDDVYNFNGSLVYSSNHHIEFFSKQFCILKKYVPEEIYVIAKNSKKESFELKGEQLYNLGNEKLLVIQSGNFMVLDINTKKRQKLDKEIYFKTLYSLLE
ncbi:MAG: hypothetical protein K0R26_827 [Bacteroidota bacterium]|nr:hypothetical protein [Bacteroidota bacterium]